MPCCQPCCVSPRATPSVSFGSCGIGSAGGYGGFGGVPASALGLTSGANVGCITQIPPSEVVLHPPPFSVVIPGAVLSASCEPLVVGGYTPCVSGGYRGGFGGSLGGGLRGVCQSKPFCVSPC